MNDLFSAIVSISIGFALGYLIIRLRKKYGSTKQKPKIKVSKSKVKANSTKSNVAKTGKSKPMNNKNISKQRSKG